MAERPGPILILIPCAIASERVPAARVVFGFQLTRNLARDHMVQPGFPHKIVESFLVEIELELATQSLVRLAEIVEVWRWEVTSML